MRRLFGIFFQLASVAIFVFACTVIWILFDGLTDAGKKADVALVLGPAGPFAGEAEKSLDLVVDLYNDGEFPMMIVSRPDGYSSAGEAAAMAKYLEDKGIPESAIIEAHLSGTTEAAARDVAGIMREHQFRSVMIVSDYYRITRTKIALYHEGVRYFQKAHFGKVQESDAWMIGHEVVELYSYLGRFYLLPAAEKIKSEAVTGLDKAKVDAQKTQQKVDKSLDSLSK